MSAVMIESDQEAYDLGYSNPSVPFKNFEFRHVVVLNAFCCGQMDAQNNAPKNENYRREDYDIGGTNERVHFDV